MTISNSKRNNIYFYIFLIIIILAGFYFRLKGLGKWPLTVDEYYTIESVKNILKHGLPQFPAGGYYDRGIIYQYFISVLLLAGVKAEFAGRIITVIANIITIIPLYLLTKKISSKFLGAVIVFIFCFSVWEVEFARFARMYAPFQMIFMWYIYFLFSFLIEGDNKKLKWLLILSSTSIFIYEGCIFLSILNFVPLIWNTQNKNIELSLFKKQNIKSSYIVISLLILFFTYMYLTTNFRYFGSTKAELLPANISLINKSSGGMFRVPNILLFTLFPYKSFLILFFLPVALSVFSIYKIFREINLELSVKIILLFLIILSIINLFGLALMIFIIFYLINGIKKDNIKVIMKFVLPVIAIYFIYWTIFALNSTLWFHYYPHEHMISSFTQLKILWKEFINYPYLYETYVLFRDTIPRTTYIIVFLLAVGLVYCLYNKNEKNINLRILFAILFLLIILVDVLSLTYFDTRYFFFIYPLIIIISYLSLQNTLSNILSKRIQVNFTLLLLVIPILFFSEDFNLRHLLLIDSREMNFRENFTLAQKIHYYPRWDTRTPAEFINKNLSSGEIVIANEQVYDYYLNRLDYFYYNYKYKGSEFANISVDKGKKERWTNASLIYDTNGLTRLLVDKKKIKWFIINTFYGNRDLDSINFFNDYKKYLVYTAQDSVTFVYKIPPKPIVSN